ncbi:MAG TPA: HAD family acid phosphatase [Thermoanaerobaculia bacterium]|nr:HAD family acid phosphatase [Thermoanaerobaculia bacterium]
MTRTVFVLCAVLLSAACATAPTPAPAAAAAAPCNPGHTILNATLWVQQSAEYRAAALQTYAAARRALDAALADSTWVGAEEETANDPSQPPAVILDVDETSLDNTPFQGRVIRKGMTYDKKMWEQWVSESAAPAIPGAREFLAYATSRGVTPFYVTNRDVPEEEPGTLQNLKNAGFPIDDKGDALLMRGENGWAGDKSPRRAHVAKSYRVLLLLGDDLNDFANARDKSAAERDAIMTRTASWWGTRWFMLPNPMYGSWESAAIGKGTTPCDDVQRKVDALRDR